MALCSLPSPYCRYRVSAAESAESTKGVTCQAHHKPPALPLVAPRWSAGVDVPPAAASATSANPGASTTAHGRSSASRSSRLIRCARSVRTAQTSRYSSASPSKWIIASQSSSVPTCGLHGTTCKARVTRATRPRLRGSRADGARSISAASVSRGTVSAWPIVRKLMRAAMMRQAQQNQRGRGGSNLYSFAAV